MKKNIFRLLSVLAMSFFGIFSAGIALADEAGESGLEGEEVFALFHGGMGLLLLLGLSAVLGGLWQANEKGFKWIKNGVIAMTVGSILIWASGTFLYSVYREPGGIKSQILAGPRPWVHSIMMEMKEFTGAYVPIIFIVMLALVLAYDKNLLSNKNAKAMFVVLLGIAVLWTMLTMGLGAFITKTAPI